LVVLCLHGGVSSDSNSPDKRFTGDYEIENTEGSVGHVPFSDDEDFISSGSGSGMYSGMSSENGDIIIDSTDEVITTRLPSTISSKTSKYNLTECQRERNFSPYVKCMTDGQFLPMQCNGKAGESECWCVDLNGKEIEGTKQESGFLPDCEEGTNIAPCTFKLVSYARGRHMLLGSFKPKCNSMGYFDRIQCRENYCFCVDEMTGKKELGTEHSFLERMNCDREEGNGFEYEEETTKNTPYAVDLDFNNNKNPIIIDDTTPEQPEDDKIDHNIDSSDDDSESSQETDWEEDNNNFGKGEVLKKKKTTFENASEIMTQPGPLAGIIAASVIILFCLVILIMFIIHRMKKKDEGSYPLDEPNRRKTNYPYVPAPQKEFYA